MILDEYGNIGVASFFLLTASIPHGGNVESRETLGMGFTETVIGKYYFPICLGYGVVRSVIVGPISIPISGNMV